MNADDLSSADEMFSAVELGVHSKIDENQNSRTAECVHYFISQCHLSTKLSAQYEMLRVKMLPIVFLSENSDSCPSTNNNNTTRH